MERQDWDDRYRTEELVWRADPNRFLVEEASEMKPGRALDLACGEGRNALWLAGRGWQVTAVDFSAVGLAKGKRLALGRGLEVEFVEADVTEWVPPPGSFDLVIVMYLHLPAAGRHLALQRAAGAVAPGGTILIVGHDSTNLTEGVGGPPDPAVLYSPEDLVADLNGFIVARAERVHRPVVTEGGERVAIDALVRAARAR